jgi:hypothetical protein
MELTEQDIKNLILLKKNIENLNNLCNNQFDDWMESLDKLYEINNIKEN